MESSDHLDSLLSRRGLACTLMQCGVFARDTWCAFLQGCAAPTTSLCNAAMTSDRFIRNKRGVGEVRSADTHLPLVVGTHVQVAQDGLGADFLIKFLIGGSIIS